MNPEEAAHFDQWWDGEKEPPREEVRSNLEILGIDTTKATARVLAAVHREKVMQCEIEGHVYGTIVDEKGNPICSRCGRVDVLPPDDSGDCDSHDREPCAECGRDCLKIGMTPCLGGFLCGRCEHGEREWIDPDPDPNEEQDYEPGYN